MNKNNYLIHCLTATLVPEGGSDTLVVNSTTSTLQSDLGTMVINQEEEEEEEEDDGTMKRVLYLGFLLLEQLLLLGL